MSDHFVVYPAISEKDFLDFVKKAGWTTGITEENDKWVHDGESYLHYDIEDGELVGMWRYGIQPTWRKMVEDMNEKFDSTIVNEHQEEYEQIMDLIEKEGEENTH